MSDPFFTKKRKRSNKTDKLTSRGPQRAKKAPRDEEISSDSDISKNGAETDSGSDNVDETPAEKRLRIAKAYLGQISKEVVDGEGFDAAEIDAELISARLEKDNLATTERIYLRLADSIDFSKLEVKETWTKERNCITSVCASATSLYATYKHGNIQRWSINDGSLHLRKTLYRAHSKDILCSAINPDGSLFATGSADRTISIWSAQLQKLHTFSQHRDSVNSLTFSPSGTELYSASSDRTVKLFNVESNSYIETLFGHQDHIAGIAAICRDLAVTCGARDRSNRIWKITEETQLVFRSASPYAEVFKEGSVDCLAQIDKEHFVVGSDNGSLSLYSSQKKKALHRVPLVHGVDQGHQVSAESDTSLGSISAENARWITAIAVVPFSDLVFSGSWSGCIVVHKLTDDNRRLEEVARIDTGRGVVTSLTVSGSQKTGFTLSCSIGYETRIGRHKTLKKARNSILRLALQ